MAPCCIASTASHGATRSDDRWAPPATWTATALADLLVGAFQADPGGVQDAGSVFLHSGATAAVLRRWDGQNVREQVGQAVANAGDVNGDGVPDQAFSAMDANPVGFPGTGRVRVHCGATGLLLSEMQGVSANDGFGFALDGNEDANGDGLPDLVLAAPWADPAGVHNGGTVYLMTRIPFLELSTDEVSASGGGRIDLDLDFSLASAGTTYQVLASAAGTGPTTVGGLEIPLTRDFVFRQTLPGHLSA